MKKTFSQNKQDFHRQGTWKKAESEKASSSWLFKRENVLGFTERKGFMNSFYGDFERLSKKKDFE